ncbi:hypothetical protein SUGI_0065580 [Cryptomeria japonica]|nr:hypothetical protein SUGI_0065580 [Cryptomeria japonica]
MATTNLMYSSTKSPSSSGKVIPNLWARTGQRCFQVADCASPLMTLKTLMGAESSVAAHKCCSAMSIASENSMLVSSQHGRLPGKS